MKLAFFIIRMIQENLGNTRLTFSDFNQDMTIHRSPKRMREGDTTQDDRAGGVAGICAS